MANVYSSRRGIKTRALYQHTALRDRATRSYLNELAQTRRAHPLRAVGARPQPGRRPVGRAAADPHRGPGGTGWPSCASRNVIAWVVATFEQLWAEAAPLEDVINRQQHDDTELDQTRAAILRLMAEGEKDEAISRRLSISVRTCRRHIADYMAQVGATEPLPGRRHRRAGRAHRLARPCRLSAACASVAFRAVLVLVIVLVVTNVVAARRARAMLLLRLLTAAPEPDGDRGARSTARRARPAARAAPAG